MCVFILLNYTWNINHTDERLMGLWVPVVAYISAVWQYNKQSTFWYRLYGKRCGDKSTFTTKYVVFLWIGNTHSLIYLFQIWMLHILHEITHFYVLVSVDDLFKFNTNKILKSFCHSKEKLEPLFIIITIKMCNCVRLISSDIMATFKLLKKSLQSNYN